MSSAMVSPIIRASARAAFNRHISTSACRSNATTTSPLRETVRTVAEAAQTGVTFHATAQGFKAGVVATLLAGSGASATYLIFGDKAAGKVVREVELL